MILEDGGAEKGTSYNTVRGDKVIASRAQDSSIEGLCRWASGSWSEATGLKIDDAQLLIELGDGLSTGLATPSSSSATPVNWARRTWLGAAEEPRGLGTLRSLVDPDSPVGATDPAGVKDVVLEAAVSTIMDLEDSVAAVDAEDKVIGYRNWLGLNQGRPRRGGDKGRGKSFTRVLNGDRSYTAKPGRGRPRR